MAYFFTQTLFPLGEITFSAGSQSLGIDLFRFLRRHVSGDWGEISEYDYRMNQDALTNNGAIVSQFSVIDSIGIVRALSIMTESDRSFTILWLNHETK